MKGLVSGMKWKYCILCYGGKTVTFLVLVVGWTSEYFCVRRLYIKDQYLRFTWVINRCESSALLVTWVRHSAPPETCQLISHRYCSNTPSSPTLTLLPLSISHLILGQCQTLSTEQPGLAFILVASDLWELKWAGVPTRACQWLLCTVWVISYLCL